MSRKKLVQQNLVADARLAEGIVLHAERKRDVNKCQRL